MEINSKKDALMASKNMLVDLLDLCSDSKNIDKIVDFLDMIDEYLRYIELLDELERLQEIGSFKIGKGYIYQLVKKYKKESKDV